jgi:hypothetical protein
MHASVFDYDFHPLPGAWLPWPDFSFDQATINLNSNPPASLCNIEATFAQAHQTAYTHPYSHSCYTHYNCDPN